MSDRQAVFFDEYHLDVKVVWHGYHIASVPVMARGAWRVPNLGYFGRPPKHFTLNNRTTAGPTDRDLVYSEALNRQFMSVGHFWGASARAHVHTPLLYLENG